MFSIKDSRTKKRRARERKGVELTEIGSSCSMEEDVVIAVMGMTGVGKSSFIKAVTGRDDIIVGHGLQSETSEVRGYSFRHKLKSYKLVDTPGFDDTYMPNEVVTTKIEEWLESSYRAGTQLNGIIYLHNIEMPRLQGSAFANLRMFRKLCGPDALKNVLLATTHWNKVSMATGKARECELMLKDQLWRKMIMAGSKVLRLDNNRESALRLLDSTVGKEKITLKVQQDMVRREASQLLLRFEKDAIVTTASTSSRTVPNSSGSKRVTNNARLGRDSGQGQQVGDTYSQWYLHRVQQQQDMQARWKAELKNVQERAELQSSLLEQVKKEAHEASRLAEQRRQERLRFYKSHVCCCKLIGEPYCAACKRRVTQVSRTFYHCCFCRGRTFLHCSDCSKCCDNPEHPQMQKLKTYCVVM